MIKQTPELRAFFYWMNERHSIWMKRNADKKPPWTRDEILREYRFTNVYRELDRVTIELHRRMDHLADVDMPLEDRLYRIILFRAFNWPPTYDVIDKAGVVSNPKKMARVLHRYADEGNKVFTGAYIVTNAGRTEPKIDVMCEAMGVISRGRRKIWDEIAEVGTMEGATQVLCQYPMMGSFTSYEVVCDLRWQRGMLDQAPDVKTWANLGPGARRGINRIVSGQKRPNVFRSTRAYVEFMQKLLAMAPKKFKWWSERPLELREIEHSLCEVDKYLRVKSNEGKPRSRFEPSVSPP